MMILHMMNLIMIRYNRKITAKMAKNMANFCENCKNHGKNMASHHELFIKSQFIKLRHLALITVITCSGRFSSVRFCHCGA